MKKIYSLVLALFGALTATAQVNLANFDFNGSTGLPLSASTTTTNITASINGTQSNAAYSGTATGSAAFIQNTTAGNGLSMSNSSGTNTQYWTLTLSGSDLNKYMNYKVYFQSEHSSTGATAITILYSTDGSTFTALSQTVSPGLNTSYTEAMVDLSGTPTLNNQAAVYIRFAASGATSSSGTLRMDNLQIQASLSPWTMSGGNVNFTGGISATSFTTTGDARINGNLTAGGLTSNSSSLNVTTPVVLSNTLKNTTLAGTGSRLLLTDATGLISPLSAGTSSQVLFGNGTWGTLPATTFTASGSNAYFSGGNLGIGNNNPTVPLDVTGNARIAGNTTITGSVSVSSLGGSSGGGYVSVDSTGNLKVLPISGGGGGSTNILLCTTQAPWMIGGNKLGSIGNAVIGTCDNHPFNLEANGVQLMSLNPNGNFVSIGNPPFYNGAMLNVGSSSANGSHALNVYLTASSQTLFDVANDGTTLINSTSTTPLSIKDPNSNYQIFFLNKAGGNGSYNQLVKANDNALIWDDGTGGNGQTTGFVLGAWNEQGVHGIRIDGATGNVGIGTSSPTAPLEVNGAAMIDGNLSIINNSQILLSGTDPNHGLGAFTTDGTSTQFANKNINGPVLFGYSGGALGSNQAQSSGPPLQNVALQWDDQGDISIFGKSSTNSPFIVQNTTLSSSNKNIFEVTAKGQLNLNYSNLNLTDKVFNVVDNSTGTSNFAVYASGYVYSREVVVMAVGSVFPDYVFNSNYKLMSLNDVKSYTEKYHHLPNMPSAKQVEENGANLGEIQRVSVEKIEELYLYLMQLSKKMEVLEKENSELKKEITEIKSK